MRIHRLPLLIFIISFTGVALSLWLSRTFDLVPDCRVFAESCFSISASGRQEPAVFVFRATIIPVGMLLILVWWLNAAWLRALDAGSRVTRFLLHLLGTFSPILLICYVALIGSQGEIDHIVRQAVITTYFPATLIAKIILVATLLRHGRSGVARWLLIAMLVIAAAVLMMAAASVALAWLVENASTFHHPMQWYGTTAFAAWYVLLSLAWRQADLRFGLDARPRQYATLHPSRETRAGAGFNRMAPRSG